MTDGTRHCDIAIIGCGPVGALLANLLGQHGLDVVVLERDTEIYPLPRAIHYDGEVMRIFQRAGLENEIAAIARASGKGMHFISNTGKTLLIRRGVEGLGVHDWVATWYVHQPFLEEVLREGMRRFPHVTFRPGHEVTDVAITPQGARLAVTEMATGAQYAVDARYVVGCDGARSLMRRLVGAEMEDLGLHQPWLVVDVLVDLDAPRVKELKDYTIQLCDPARPMTLGYVAGNRRRWEIMLMPGDDPQAMVEHENIWPLISRWLDPSIARFERAAVYTFHSLVARGWRKGPLFLAGDACHQTPPFLGQGMCAGIRDAANLAWKFDRVFRGVAGESLLDSYESERRPHVHDFIKLAVELGAVIQATDPAKAEQRDRQFKDGSPKLFDFPDPALGPGVHLGGAMPVAQVFPQPRLDDGRRLDDAIGGEFALLGTADFIAALDGATVAELERTGVRVLRSASAGVAKWLQEKGVGAVLLRPDSYIFAMVDGGAALTAALRNLRGHLAAPAEGAARRA